MIIKPDEKFVLNPIDAHGVGFGRPCPDNCPILQDGANIRVVEHSHNYFFVVVNLTRYIIFSFNTKTQNAIHWTHCLI